MRLISLSSYIVLFGALSLASAAPGVRPLVVAGPATWWKANQDAHEAKSTWHAHEKGGPGKYPREVLDKLEAVRDEGVKQESSGTTVEIPKEPVRPADNYGGGSMPGRQWKKREEDGGTVDYRKASSAPGGREDKAGWGGGMSPGKGWRRHIGDAESGDAVGNGE